MAESEHKTCNHCNQSLSLSRFPRVAINRDGKGYSCRECLNEKRREYLCGLPQNEAADRNERKRAYDRARYLEKRDQYIESAKRRYIENPEITKRRVARWSKDNPARRRAISQNYKHGRRAAEGAKISSRELQDWIDSQDKACVYCLVDCLESYHVDHVIPLAKGGQHCTSNLAIACPTCNLRKSDKMPEVFLSEMEAA